MQGFVEKNTQARQEQCPKCEGWKSYTSKESGKTYICSYCKGTGIVWRKNEKERTD